MTPLAADIAFIIVGIAIITQAARLAALYMRYVMRDFRPIKNMETWDTWIWRLVGGLCIVLGMMLIGQKASLW